MQEAGKRIIEVNGIKMEVDFSRARRVDEFKIGDPVKVLKKDYSDQWKVCPGIIIGFENFINLPTITVAYLEVSYSGADVKFLYYNKQTKDVEISYADNVTEIPFEASTVIEQMDKQILNKQTEVEELRRKREYFMNNFKMYFKDFVSKFDDKN